MLQSALPLLVHDGGPDATTRAARQCVRSAGVALALVAAAASLSPALAAEPAGARLDELVHMVRQDCGSCHGMRLTGGLGPALTPQALAGKPIDSLVATIYQGRPGTPMPGWRTMLTEEEARWIAEALLAGAIKEKP